MIIKVIIMVLKGTSRVIAFWVGSGGMEGALPEEACASTCN